MRLGLLGTVQRLAGPLRYLAGVAVDETDVEKISRRYAGDRERALWHSPITARLEI